MRYIKPKKLRVILYAFMATGIFGIIVGLVFSDLYVTFLGAINLCLGGFVGWIYLTQAPKKRDSRKPPHN